MVRLRFEQFLTNNFRLGKASGLMVLERGLERLMVLKRGLEGLWNVRRCHDHFQSGTRIETDRNRRASTTFMTPMHTRSATSRDRPLLPCARTTCRRTGANPPGADAGSRVPWRAPEYPPPTVPPGQYTAPDSPQSIPQRRRC